MTQPTHNKLPLYIALALIALVVGIFIRYLPAVTHPPYATTGVKTHPDELIQLNQ